MDREELITAQLRQQGLLPLFYHANASVCIAIIQALYTAGIRQVEFTNRGEAALSNFKALVRLRDTELKDLVLATGTIRTAEQANRFIDAGADYLISPVFDADVCDAAYITKTMWIPGCMTPTEIHTAANAGCRVVKLFPGNVLGPGFVTAIRELFPAMQFMPTGGVDGTTENLSAWFKAGVMAVGMGSKLITPALVEAGAYNELTSQVRQLLETIQQIRS